MVAVVEHHQVAVDRDLRRVQMVGPFELALGPQQERLELLAPSRRIAQNPYQPAVAVERLAHVLRIALLGEGCEADEVGEEDRDQAALSLGGLPVVGRRRSRA